MEVKMHTRRLNPYADEKITVTSSAVKTLTANTYQDVANRKVAMAKITVEGGDMHYRVTGDDPTSSVGHKLTAGDILTLTNLLEIKKFKAIADGGTDGILYVTYYEFTE